MKRLVFVSILLLLILGTAWRIREKTNIVESPTLASIQSSEGIPIQTIGLERADLQESVQFHGSLYAAANLKIYAEVAGVLAERFFDTGDRVEAGQVLARIKDDEFQAQFLMAEADLKIAEANLAKARKGARDQEVDAARAALAQARAGAERARDDLKRLQGLFRSRSISRSQLDSAERAAEAALAMQQAAEANLSAVEEGTRSEDLAVAEAALQAAQGRFALARLTYEKTRIKAPASGIISERNYEVGDFLLPATNPTGKLLCRILDIDTLHFHGRLNERYLSQIQVGDILPLYVSALDYHCTATVLLMDPAGDPHNRDFRLELRLDNQEGRLKPGMYACARLILQDAPSALCVSRELLLEQKGDSAKIFTVNQGTARLQDVKLGVRDGQRIEIKEGLQLTDRVVSVGYQNLRDGVRVRITNGENQ